MTHRWHGILIPRIPDALVSRCRYDVIAEEMAVVVLVAEGLAVGPSDPGRAWCGCRSRTWPEREVGLERRHERPQALLADPERSYAVTVPAGPALDRLACERACRRLLWQLRLHLRLEERWRTAAGCLCLCPGHRAAHADVAFGGFNASASDHATRSSIQP